jgi:hypothetical protein
MTTVYSRRLGPDLELPGDPVVGEVGVGGGGVQPSLRPLQSLTMNKDGPQTPL